MPAGALIEKKDKMNEYDKRCYANVRLPSCECARLEDSTLTDLVHAPSYL